MRTKHGALLDAELTSQVYLELLGGRQKRLSLSPIDRAADSPAEARTARMRPQPLPSRLTAAEAEAHLKFVAEELGTDSLWNKVSGGS